MVDFHIGITLHFNKNKPAPMTGKVFYQNGQHVIEIHDVRQAGEFIRGLLPPYTEEESTNQPTTVKENHGIG